MPRTVGWVLGCSLTATKLCKRRLGPPIPFHGFAKELVDPGLVSASLALQPSQHIGVHANRHWLLMGVTFPTTAPPYSRTSGESVKSILWSGIRGKRKADPSLRSG